MKNLRLYFLIFTVSMATLALEVLQLRIFAYSLMRSIAHIVVSIALLGIGIGNISTAIFPGFSRIKEERLFLCLLFGFSLSVLAVHLVFAGYYREINQDYNFPRLWLFSIIFSIPYVFFFAFITYVFKSYAEKAPKLYAVNLIGSGFGCIIPLLLLYPLGAEKLILIISLIAAAAVMPYVFDTSRKVVFFTALYIFLLLFSIPYADSIFNFKPKPHGAISRIAGVTPVKKEFSRWDPLGRIEVYSYEDKFSYIYLPEPLPIKEMFQDGDAGSWLLGMNSAKGSLRGADNYRNFFTGSIFSLAYQLHNKPEAMIIGLGGAPDILRALYFQGSKITGVEINKTTISIVRDTFKDFIGDPYGRDNVEIINMDGRHFAKSNAGKYDVIQIAGADTDTTNLTSGALSVSENYLYTTQAFKDYFSSLKDNGVLSIIRFGDREPMVILTTAIKAMKEMGIKEPYRNFIIVKQAICTDVMMKRTPFTEEDVSTIKRFVEGINMVADSIRIPIDDMVGYEAVNKAEIQYMPLQYANDGNPFAEFIAYSKADEEGRYISGFHQNIEPLTDDKPFFFQYEKIENIFKYKNSVIYNLIKTAFQVFVFSVLLIFLPVYILKRKQAAMGYNFSYLIYFFSLGIGFMLVEIGIIQKSVLFLGHPTYSFITVLFSILLFSGIGSLASAFIKDSFKAIAISMCAVVVMIFFYSSYMESMYIRLLPANTALRMITMGLLLSPLGFVMGMPFPKGIQMVSKRDANFVPLSFAVNSVFSVLGAVSSVPFAMIFGFSKLFLLAAAAYAFGLVSIMVGRR
ncbi:MAG: hypothetical protein HY756_01775 [Nitrospirae bacterium]|nr:hypothetical protein [Nitrospirota bacterium]